MILHAGSKCNGHDFTKNIKPLLTSPLNQDNLGEPVLSQVSLLSDRCLAAGSRCQIFNGSRLSVGAA